MKTGICAMSNRSAKIYPPIDNDDVENLNGHIMFVADRLRDKLPKLLAHPYFEFDIRGLEMLRGKVLDIQFEVDEAVKHLDEIAKRK
ncbi:MAG: hypothetical protein HKO68_08800 [Desulfobacterales bacterium]|nr:hypothetical protein [Desulfobacterales bacterium]NNL76419.1 hypothetical protein [Desulfobacterales bacterium]